MGDATSKEGINRAERKDPGIDAKGLDGLGQKKEEKTWTQTLSGGYLGGSK